MPCDEVASCPHVTCPLLELKKCQLSISVISYSRLPFCWLRCMARFVGFSGDCVRTAQSKAKNLSAPKPVRRSRILTVEIALYSASFVTGGCLKLLGFRAIVFPGRNSFVNQRSECGP